MTYLYGFAFFLSLILDDFGTPLGLNQSFHLGLEWNVAEIAASRIVTLSLFTVKNLWNAALHPEWYVVITSPMEHHVHFRKILFSRLSFAGQEAHPPAFSGSTFPPFPHPLQPNRLEDATKKEDQKAAHQENGLATEHEREAISVFLHTLREYPQLFLMCLAEKCALEGYPQILSLLPDEDKNESSKQMS